MRKPSDFLIFWGARLPDCFLLAIDIHMYTSRWVRFSHLLVVYLSSISSCGVRCHKCFHSRVSFEPLGAAPTPSQQRLQPPKPAAPAGSISPETKFQRALATIDRAVQRAERAELSQAGAGAGIKKDLFGAGAGAERKKFGGVR